MKHSLSKPSACSSIYTKGSSSSTTTLRVVAPATLEEGYQFDVMLHNHPNYNNKPYTVTVPKGGVRVGQEFEIPLELPSDTYSDDEDDNDDNEDVDEQQQQQVPDKSFNHQRGRGQLRTHRESLSDNTTLFIKETTGRWRRSLCSCCDVLTQSTFWMGFVCTPILIAQLLTRLGLDWKGHKCPENEEGREERALTFNRIVLSAIAVLLLGYIPLLGAVIVMVYWFVVVVWIGSNLRGVIRQRYHIPSTTCGYRSDCSGGASCCCCCSSHGDAHQPGKLDDCLSMMFCAGCTAIQMARQTHDDHEFPGYCCTTTGLPLDAPKLV